jgi:enterochelin esterase family protein
MTAIFPYGPDSQRQADVPRGEALHFQHSSTIFTSTRRDYWVYAPQQYDPTSPAAVMIFQDGHAYLKEDGDFRAPIVFDNLLHTGTMPVTIGIFLTF